MHLERVFSIGLTNSQCVRVSGTRREGSATGHLDMLHAVLLAATKQGCAQGAAHVRYAARHEFARHQPRSLPHHHVARRGAATSMRTAGKRQSPLIPKPGFHHAM